MPEKSCSITIDRGWCKQCGLCIAFCPREVLANDANGDVQVVNREACTGCLICELLCPELSITIDVQEKESVGKEE